MGENFIESQVADKLIHEYSEEKENLLRVPLCLGMKCMKFSILYLTNKLNN
jgi:hypothetical protein